MWPFSGKGPSGFSWHSTAEEVTQGIDGSGLVAIVTGASSGIGSETARILAKCGVHVIMAVRNVSCGTEVKQTILKEFSGAKIDVLELDLSSFASVRLFASKFDSLNLPLNILVNNAGVMATPFSLSQDGIELQFATNHLGHFLLTNLLLENMRNTSSTSNTEGRIVILSSEAHRFAYGEGIRFDKINDKSTFTISDYPNYYHIMPVLIILGRFRLLRYNTARAYGQSKLANILHANELSRRFTEEGVKITANSLHPGSINTNLLRHHSFIDFIAKTAGKLVLKNVQQGAATTCYVALHPQVSGVSGKYFSDSNIATPSSKAADEELAKKLWEFSLKTVG